MAKVIHKKLRKPNIYQGKTEYFLPRIRNKTRMFALPTFVPETVAKVITQENQMHSNWKAGSKTVSRCK